jgi:hypothetical protein
MASSVISLPCNVVTFFALNPSFFVAVDISVSTVRVVIIIGFETDFFFTTACSVRRFELDMGVEERVVDLYFTIE